MTYASHARVITGIIQANLIHLSIKMTTPHQSGAPFVGERVFQNGGVCGQAFPSFPSPTPFLQPFCSRPIFRASRMRKTNTRCPNFVRFVRERLLRSPRGGGGGVLPYMGYIGMCDPKGYGFSAVLVINRVSILADFGHFGHK